jgi:hypothetical protein
MTTLTPEQQAIADCESKKAASQDLTLAREEGHILICQTKRGTLFLTYADGQYALTACGEETPIATGSRATVRKALAPLYDVIFTEEK